MENKLQELTDKLYNEGLSKGKAEGEAILADAKSKAAQIVSEAEKKAQDIVAKAEKEAADYKNKVSGDLKMAAVQSVQATKKDIENLVVMQMVAPSVDKILSSEEFVKETIKAVAAKFDPSGATDLDVVLPESLKENVGAFVQNELSKQLSGKINVSFSKKIGGGFSIGPSEGGYFISLTDETFKDLLCEYLRPTAKKLLFGE